MAALVTTAGRRTGLTKLPDGRTILVTSGAKDSSGLARINLLSGGRYKASPPPREFRYVRAPARAGLWFLHSQSNTKPRDPSFQGTWRLSA